MPHSEAEVRAGQTWGPQDFWITTWNLPGTEGPRPKPVRGQQLTRLCTNSPGGPGSERSQGYRPTQLARIPDHRGAQRQEG